MKKRTCIHGYGKFHQSHQSLATAAMQRGDKNAVEEHFAALKKPNPVGGRRRPANTRGH
jgi:hypothetical protein